MRSVSKGMMTMKITAAVLESQNCPEPFSESKALQVKELVLDAPGPTEVLVKITSAGLCHSDLSVLQGNRIWPTPLVVGHEAAGVVQEVGAKVKDFHEGDHVVMTFLPRCEECRACQTGGKLPCSKGVSANNAGTLLNGSIRLHDGDQQIHHHLGVSGFATHAVVDQASIVKVPQELPADISAVLGCAMITGGGAVLNELDPKPGQSFMVVGLGGVGMAGLLTSLACEGVEVTAADVSADKLELAKQFGAHHCLTTKEVEEKGVTADLVLEAAGHPKAFETAYKAICVGGKMVTIGLPAPDEVSQIHPTALTAGARTVMGSYMGSAVPKRDVPKFAELYLDGKLPLDKLITSHIKLEDINEGMDRLAAGKELRQIIQF